MYKALILVAAILIASGCVSDTPAVKSLGDERENVPYASDEINQIKSELQIALVSGGISPESYSNTVRQINQLEARGINVAELKAMLSRLSVGGSPREVQSDTHQIETQQRPETQLQTDTPQLEVSPQVVIWHNMQNGSWVPKGKPPDCPEQIVFQSPVDLKLATAILYPGQVRGGDFKPHGGFRTDGATGPVEVTAPMEGYIWNAARFYDEFGIHYMFDIQHPCGIMYRLGHLGAVPEKLDRIFDNLPESAKGDSRTHLIDPPVFVELGETIATDTQHGSGFDWGVYDLRKENEAAQDPVFREAHKDEISQAYYAFCWFDYLPADQENIVRGLPAADGKSGKTSDYC